MNQEIKEKMTAYYTTYYRDVCSLSDYAIRVEERLHEEEKEKKTMGSLEKKLGVSFANKKHCFVGAGTAGAAIAVQKEFGGDVYGIEPADDAFDIIQLKCEEANIPKEHFKKECAESMTFEDDQFDIVHCYTVLEHVMDVEKTIDQMIRITKPGGVIYIQTPNYRFPFERHYKIIFPTFLPKWIGGWYLRLARKSPDFLKSINFITEKQINRLLLRKQEIVWYRLYQSMNKDQSRLKWLWNLLLFKFFVYPNQEIIIKKINFSVSSHE